MKKTKPLQPQISVLSHAVKNAESPILLKHHTCVEMNNMKEKRDLYSECLCSFLSAHHILLYLGVWQAFVPEGVLGSCNEAGWEVEDFQLISHTSVKNYSLQVILYPRKPVWVLLTFGLGQWLLVFCLFVCFKGNFTFQTGKSDHVKEQCSL